MDSQRAQHFITIYTQEQGSWIAQFYLMG
jgi:hypothetical protein